MDSIQSHKLGWHRLFYTKCGDLDLSWFLVSMFSLMAAVGFAADIIKKGQPSWNAWGFLGGAFMAVLIAAVPRDKARILAGAKSIGALAQAAGSNQPNMWTDNEVGGDHYLNQDREHVGQLEQ
jgi:hypothetical protein